jgi:hypothetical protein
MEAVCSLKNWYPPMRVRGVTTQKNNVEEKFAIRPVISKKAYKWQIPLLKVM